MSIAIRTATESDLPDILNIYAQPEMDNGHVLSIKDAKVLFHKLETYPYYVLFIAELENKIVGTFALLIMDNLIHRGDLTGIVEAVAVDPHYQGKGIGKAMMQFAMDECKKQKCKKLVLSSNIKRKNAHRFYESLGFAQHGISFSINL